MKLSDKIVNLRKERGLSQEELAEKLGISRQAVSRWEGGYALPDAQNVLQLSKLFDVTADYLLNDDYKSDFDVPAVKNSKTKAKNELKKWLALGLSLFGLSGNFIIYILSRFIEVPVPSISYENGVKIYHWSSAFTGRSYKYFIWEYDLEFLAAIFWIIFILGIVYIFLNSDKIKNLSKKNTRAQK